MNTDIRISVGLLTNRKVKRLIRRKGHTGFYNLISLWVYAGVHCPSGEFEGMDKEDLMDAAETSDECFVDLLVDLNLLELKGGVYRLRNWRKHNGYAATAEERSQKARDAANKRWNMRFSGDDKSE